MRRLAVAVTAAMTAAGIATTTATAHPVSPTVAPHVHLLTTPGGTHEIGPSACGPDGVTIAFQQFHNNIHIGQPGTDAWLGVNPVSIGAARC